MKIVFINMKIINIGTGVVFLKAKTNIIDAIMSTEFNIKGATIKDLKGVFVAILLPLSE